MAWRACPVAQYALDAPARNPRAGFGGAVPSVPADLEQRIHRLTLAEVVDLGLRNNPTTRLSWANARAAAAAYGSARGAYLPTIDGDVTATRLKTVASQGRSAVTQSVLSPSLSLTYLLFDFGGRSGTIGAARNALVAAELYSQRDPAERGAADPVGLLPIHRQPGPAPGSADHRAGSRTNLAAAEERNRVGVATIADVLQARTAASQAELAAQATEGDLQTSRGALALSLGLPANLPYDIDSTAAQAPVAVLADSVDALIARAVQARPDLAAARAEYEASETRSRLREPTGSRRWNSMEPGDEPTPPRSPRAATTTRCRSAFESRSLPVSPGSTISDRPRPWPTRPPPEPMPWGSRWSSRCSARIYALRTADPPGAHQRGPHRQCPALERCGLGQIQSRGGIRAGSPDGPNRARRRPRPAGLARLEWNTLAGAAGPRCRSPR